MKILLVGDYCTDCFMHGDVSRLAPEAPVAVLVPTDCITNPGMGGNVLSNLKSLAPDAEITALLPNVVNMKIRYVDKKTGHHFLRVDEPDQCETLSNLKWRGIFDNDGWDAVVVSDYCKGFLNEELLVSIGRNCLKMLIPLFVDTKRQLGEWSLNAIVKLNEYEAAYQQSTPWAQCEHLIVTYGAGGMRLFGPDGIASYHSPALGQVEVKDGAGCGDSVLAALVVRYLENGKDLKDAMDWANKVGAIAVSKRGVVAVRREDVK